MIAWFARNSVAANILMFGIIMAGLVSAFTAIPVETFPSLERSVININTQFRGATPKTAEDGITLRIEEAIADLEGIKEIFSRSNEGSSNVQVDVIEGYDERELLDDIKVRVDALNTLPVDAEKPIVSIAVRNYVVIYVAVNGDVDTRTLKETAARFREGLLAHDSMSNVDLQGVADYEMTIEVSPQALDNYNLSLEDIGKAIRSGAADISAGNVQTRDGDILVRSDGQAYSAEEYARIPIISNDVGQPIRLGDIATINDGFEESLIKTTFNGKPAVMVEVRRVGEQSAIQVAQDTRLYMEKFSRNIPSGVSLDYWDDDSEYLKSRINVVLTSALYGGILVLLLLSLFLRPAVAFWVFLGVPISFMGAFLFMPQVNGTFNVVSLFAFIMVLGIVVDDAIVTGENIYRKIREGHNSLEASILGTQEIAVPVTFGILTTVVAFAPLSFLGDTRLAFLASQLPMVVIPVLLMSLVESKLILPAHLSHLKVRDQNSRISKFGQLQQGISRWLERTVENVYQPFLDKCVENKPIVLSALVSVALIVFTYTYLGHLRYSQFPSVESDSVRVSLTMNESSGFASTDREIQRIAGVFKQLQDKYTDPDTGKSVITNILARSGSSGRTIKANVGQVRAEIQLEEERTLDVNGFQLGREAMQMIGEIPAAKKLSVRTDSFGSNAPINIELSGDNPQEMGELVRQLRLKLKEFPAIYDIQDNFIGGKEELKIELKPRAHSLGLNLRDVASQVRHAVFGFQAQRIQRGRDELRVMVRYPLENRSSVEDLYQLPIRVPGSSEEVLLTEIANVQPSESPTSLYRLNRRSISNVTADVNKDQANVPIILSEIEAYLESIQSSYPGVSYRFDGEAEESAETNSKLMLGLVVILVAIYGLLAIPLKSYGQPLIVMSIIPFSLVGAFLGHIITFQTLSSMSFYGILALVGVVVNDSLVLVDYINKRRAAGMEVLQAVLSAGAVRFRPVLLTSITTFAGVMPLLLDPTQQAKWLKPMATSLGFGILFATFTTLIIVPINYLLGRKIKYACIGLFNRWLEFWNRPDGNNNAGVNQR